MVEWVVNKIQLQESESTTGIYEPVNNQDKSVDGDTSIVL